MTNMIYILLAILFLAIFIGVVEHPLLSGAISFIIVFCIASMCHYPPFQAALLSFMVTFILMIYQGYGQLEGFKADAKTDDEKNIEEIEKVAEKTHKEEDINGSTGTVPTSTDTITADDIDVDAENTYDYSEPETAEDIDTKKQVIGDRGRTITIDHANKNVNSMDPAAAQRKLERMVNSINKLKQTTESLGMLLDKSEPLIKMFHSLPNISS